MGNTVILTKKFGLNLKLYCENKKNLITKVISLKSHLEASGFDIDLFKQYDIKNLGDNYFRVKFIPYRIIILIKDNHTFEFVDLFKRKGKSDYKKYN